MALKHFWSSCAWSAITSKGQEAMKRENEHATPEIKENTRRYKMSIGVHVINILSTQQNNPLLEMRHCSACIQLTI